MKSLKFIVCLNLLLLNLLVFNCSFSQDNSHQVLSLIEVIDIAKSQSIEAISAKHSWKKSYWENRTYNASFLPNISLNSNLLDYSNSIRKTISFGQDDYQTSSSNNSSIDIGMIQKVPFTGGELFIQSNLNRLDNFTDSITKEYASIPLIIGFSQPLNGYNEFKWTKKIEPKKFERASLQYFQTLEQISIRAINLFFKLITAQINMGIVSKNFMISDTLYNISKGRYEIGTISENELLQMELNLLNAGLSLNNAESELEQQEKSFKLFLGIDMESNIFLVLPDELPIITLEKTIVLQKAKENNPEYINFELTKLEAEKNIAIAKSQNGLNANITASYGLNQNSPYLPEVYQEPLYRKGLRVGITIPIIDWGLAKGKHQMAKSNYEIVKYNVMKREIDIEQSLSLKLKQFEQQYNQVFISAKADTIAQKRYEVSKQRFMIGKISVLELNEAYKDKDISKNSYINALNQYWTYYYEIRQLTLFDFENFEPIVSQLDIYNLD